MAAHRYQSSFNGIIFNRQLQVDGGTLYEQLYGPDDERRLDPAFAQSDYRLESLDLTRVTVEEFRELRQFLEGAEANEAFEGVLIATGRGTIHGSTVGDLEDKTWAMRSAFSPAAVRIAALATDPVGVLPFDFSVAQVAAPTYSRRRLYVRPAIGRPVVIGRMREGLSRRFLIQLVSMDPRVVSQTLQQVVANLGGQNLTNAGNAYTHAKIRIAFSGAGNAALTITNTTTGQAIVINATTAVNGQAWILDSRTGRLYLESTGANRYSQRVSGYIAQLWLPVGVSAWTFANIGGVSEVRFDFRNAWA